MAGDMNQDIERVLVSEEEIDRITTRIAAQIDRDYGDGKHNLVLVCILKGSIMFMGALMAKIKTKLEIDFMRVSSYENATVSCGDIRIHLNLSRGVEEIKSLDLLIIEDIIDSGRTLAKLTEELRFRGAKSVRTCTLLDKPSRRVVKGFTPDYVGVEVPDEFVVGFGLDYGEKYRNLPYVGVLKREVYEKKCTKEESDEK